MTSPEPIRQQTWRTPRTAALRPLACLVAAFAILKTQADPDLWGHVRFGMDILRDRLLPSIDPYSFTQDLPWINHEWLSELFMGAAYQAWGVPGLMLLKGIFAVCALALIWSGLRHAAEPWRWGGLALAAAGVLPLTFTLRPQLWTLVLLAGLCRLLVLGGRPVWAIPALFVVWANVHGGWVLGLGVLAVWTAGELPKGGRDARRRLVLVVALSVLATLVTPYGWELWRFIAATVRLSRTDVTEWQPIWRYLSWRDAWSAITWFGAVGFIGLCWRRHGRPSLSTLAVLLMLAFASMRVVRLVPLFVLVSVLLLATQFPRRVGKAPAPRARTAMDIAAVALALVFSVQTRTLPTCIRIEEWPAPPDLIALTALTQSRPVGRMVTFFDWGEMVLAHLGPGLKVSIDGRRETVYSSRTLREQLAIATGEPDGLRALHVLSPDYVWLPLPQGRRTATWLRQHGYRIDLETPLSFVAARNDRPAIAIGAATTPTGCFPAP